MIVANRNYPPSTPNTVVIPLIMSIKAPIMDPSKYSLFLAGRINEKEFKQDCEDMKQAFLNDPEMAKAAEDLNNFMDMTGSAGCSGTCCGFLCATCLCMGIPYIGLVLFYRNVGTNHTAAWQRVLGNEFNRLNEKYANMMVRFELGQETRISSISTNQNGHVGSSSTTSYWASITVAGPAVSPQPVLITGIAAQPTEKAYYNSNQQYGGPGVQPLEVQAKRV